MDFRLKPDAMQDAMKRIDENRHHLAKVFDMTDRPIRQRLTRPDGTILFEHVWLPRTLIFEPPQEIPFHRELDGDTEAYYVYGERIFGKFREEISYAKHAVKERFLVTPLPGGGCTAERANVPDPISVRVTHLEMLNNPGEKLSDLLEVRISLAEERLRAAKPAPETPPATASSDP